METPRTIPADRVIPTGLTASTRSDRPSHDHASRWLLLLTAIALALLGWVVYQNSFQVPFMLDDVESIQNNKTLDHLGTALAPPPNSGFSGHPFASLTFALNRAWGGQRLVDYHVVNLLIHLAAGLALFGIVRRTLSLPNVATRFGAADWPLAFAIAAIWTVHPLHTESVTYLSQRTESLVGLLYLLSLYAFLRSAASSGGGWRVMSVLVCITGAFTKEAIVTAPIMILLFDRTFVSDSFRQAWKLRWRYYLGLSVVWLVLAVQLISLRHHNGGLAPGVSAFSYVLASCRSFMTYLRLSVWPEPLIFDYGPVSVTRLRDVAIECVALAALLGVTIWGLWRRSALGFLGAWFFGILAAVISLAPVLDQPCAEHRMYLPVAAVIVAVVCGLFQLLGRWSFVLCTAICVALGWNTVKRNDDYRSELTIWDDTIAKLPNNARAHTQRGMVLDTSGRLKDATQEFETATRLKPDWADAHLTLANAYFRLPDRLKDAVGEYRRAVQLKPGVAEFHSNLANALVRGRLWSEAIAEYEEALRIKPNLPEVHYYLATALVRDPQGFARAEQNYEDALKLKPEYGECHYNLAVLFSLMDNRNEEAIAHYREAARILPNNPQVHFNLALLLRKTPATLPEAIHHFEEVLRIEPKNQRARQMLDTLHAGDQPGEGRSPAPKPIVG